MYVPFKTKRQFHETNKSLTFMPANNKLQTIAREFELTYQQIKGVRPITCCPFVLCYKIHLIFQVVHDNRECLLCGFAPEIKIVLSASRIVHKYSQVRMFTVFPDHYMRYIGYFNFFQKIHVVRFHAFDIVNMQFPFVFA